MEAMAARELLLKPQEGQTWSKGKPVWEVIFEDGLVRQYAVSDVAELQQAIWYNRSTPRLPTRLDSLDQLLLWDAVKTIIPSYGMVHLAKNRERIEYQVCVNLPGSPLFLVRVKAFNAGHASLCLHESRNGGFNLPFCPARLYPRLEDFEKMLRFLGAEKVSIQQTQAA